MRLFPSKFEYNTNNAGRSSVFCDAAAPRKIFPAAHRDIHSARPVQAAFDSLLTGWMEKLFLNIFSSFSTRLRP